MLKHNLFDNSDDEGDNNINHNGDHNASNTKTVWSYNGYFTHSNIHKSDPLKAQLSYV